MKKIIIIVVALLVIPNISFANPSQSQIDGIRAQIWAITIQIQGLQRILNSLTSRSRNLDNITIMTKKPKEQDEQKKEEIKKEEKDTRRPVVPDGNFPRPGSLPWMED